MKRTIEHCKEWAKIKDGECLSSVYKNPHSKLKWKCSKGHIWEASPNKIRIGSWCKECFRPSIGLDKARQLAYSRDGQCLSSSYVNNTSKLKWKCNKGHIWDASWKSVNQGNWCPECGIKRSHDLQRLDISYCHKIAVTRGGECLSTEYLNTETKYKWKCSKGHIWSATYDAVANAGSWCSKCSNILIGLKLKNSISDAEKLAVSKGGKCLSTEYNTAFHKLLWQCGTCSNKWEASYNNVQRGRWCPDCKLSKTEKEVRSIFEQLTANRFPKRRFAFNNKRFELDGYCEELALAFEYDGEQHFLPVSYWGGEEGLKKTKLRDVKKDLICKELGITLIRIPYTEKNNLLQFITDKLITNNVKIV